MKNESRCGLMTSTGAVPLDGVRIEARLSGACTELTVTQRFENREKVPVEAVYVFPLEERAAVCGFAAVVGDQVIRGKVEEREAAFAQYDDAMARGDGAFLLDQERPNVFTASVGNLRPGEVVELQIRYVALATREGDATRLTIPTTVSPRYVPPQGAPEVGRPDGERVNPPHWPSVPYGLTLTVDIDGEKLRRVESPSHPVRTTMGDASTRVELSREDTALDRDFVLLVERAEPSRPEARVARDGSGGRVAMVTFLPRFEASRAQGHEIQFLLDCSGSMAGESIEQARRALSLCVRALGPEDTFNVVCFGSSHQSLWKKPRAYDDKSLEEATKYIAHIDANLGGTEILAPLTALLEAKPDPERPRRILVLTDGQVSNEDQVLGVARQHAGTTRIFTFGIGAGASEHLVRGTARASRGAAEMIFPGERIEPKVLRTFGRVRMPVFDDVRVDWKNLRVEQAPSRVPPVFAGEALTVFARVESGSASEVELSFGDQRFAVAIDLERPENGGPIPTLWAREAILELDDASAHRGSAQRRPQTDDRRRARLVELGTQYGLLSSATSYVVVEERRASEQTTTPAELRKVPVALTSGWGGGQQPFARTRAVGVMRASAPLPPMAAPMAPMMRRVMHGPAPTAPGSSGGAPPPPLAAKPFFARVKEALFDRGSDEGMEESTLAESSPPVDLFDVLMTQTANGGFPLTAPLLEWLGTERAARLHIALARVPESIAVTTVLLAVLERDHGDREAEWRPAAEKAKAWLAQQPMRFDPSAVL